MRTLVFRLFEIDYLHLAVLRDLRQQNAIKFDVYHIEHNVHCAIYNI